MDNAIEDRTHFIPPVPLFRVLDGPEGIQGSPEWLEFKRFKIGASDVPIILGHSPWKTPLQLFNEKIEGISPQPNAAMRRGTALEEEARAIYNRISGIHHTPCVIQRVDYPWAIASLDGAAFTMGTLYRACEIKCVGRDTFDMAREGKIPQYYIDQMQAQMLVSGLPRVYYVCFLAESLMSMSTEESVVVIPVWRDQEAIDAMVPVISRFHDGLMNFVPPEPSDKDQVEIFDEMALSDVQRYKSLTRQLKLLEDEIEVIRNAIIAHCGSARTRIGEAQITKSFCKGAVAYDKVPELKGVDLDKYRKPPIMKWRIKIDE